MKTWSFPFAEVNRNSFALKVANGNVDYRNFFEYQPNLQGIYDAKEKKRFPSQHRKTLVDALKGQYEQWEIPVPANVSRLLQEDTFTVTTGHQLNFLSGPHFFFTKIASTIHLSRLVGSDCIPVFWMASEDHDFEEIASAILFGKTFQMDSTNSAAPVGRMNMSESWEQEVQKAVELLSSDWAKSIIKQAYKVGFSLSKCIARLVHEIFGAFGLIILDGDSVALKNLAYPIFEKEFEEQILAKKVTDQNEVLTQFGIEAQVYHRDVNLFSLSSISRIRLEKNDPQFKSLQPVEISPNALMRPLYQEFILPNLAYIGGAAEVAYWAQLKQAFAEFQIQMPVVLLRPSVFFVDSKQHQWLEKWNWKIQDAFLDDNQLIKKFIQQQPNHFSVHEYLETLKELELDAKSKIEKIEPTLISTLSAEIEKMKGMWLGLEKKVEKSIKQKQETEVQRIGKLKNAFFPDQIFQERKINGFQFIQNQQQIEQLIDTCSPIQPQIHAFLV
jgi:bacillithiol biosynthesis cysteine-adding enzyme BshC